VRLRHALSNYAIFVALVAECVVLAVATDAFFTVDNLSNVLRQNAFTAILAAGMTFVILTAGIDLSVGSVVGPTLVPVSSAMAPAIGLPPLAGPYLVPVVFVAIAAILSFALLRPDPYAIADDSAPQRGTPVAAGATTLALGQMLRRPGVTAAIVALVAGQFVMTLIMTMTPLHMTQQGHGLGAVGIVLSAHTLGMFALSPLSGRLAERVGTVRAIFIGTAVLGVSAVMAAVAPPTGGDLLLVALFLLGLGWNIGFVAGSALLSEHLEVHERTRVQGVADALIWSSAAAASLGSGVIMAAAGYTALGVLGTGLVLIPILTLRAHRQALAHRHGEPDGETLLP